MTVVASCTYVVVPKDLLDVGIGVDVTLEVHVIVLLDVVGVQVAAHLKRHHRLVWGRKKSCLEFG